MIPNSLTFPIRAFVAFVVITITSRLTSVYGAAPTKFARNLRPDSVPALVMAGYNEKRAASDDQNRVLGCTAIPDDIHCLLNNGVLAKCEAVHDRNDDNTGLVSCLTKSCPGTHQDVVGCVTDPAKSIDDNNQEAIILDFNKCPIAGGTSIDQMTCLKIAFENCVHDNTDRAGFTNCMTVSCRNVQASVIGCIGDRYAQFWVA